MTLRIAIAAFVIVDVLRTQACAQQSAIDATWAARVRTQGKAAYDKYRSLRNRLEEESESRVVKAPGSASKLEDAIAFGSNSERIVRLGNDHTLLEKIWVLDREPNRPLIRLDCENEDYYFELAKGTATSPYALVSYGKGKSKNPLATQVLGGLHLLVSTDWHMVLTALGAFDDASKSNLRGVQFEATSNLVRVHFQYQANKVDTECQGIGSRRGQ
ncbi:MAG: hypothetical protein FJ271_15355 [Planctomycetes bacterium]|nr:hypothetical protein [Planctomycetota bacterium]